MLGVNLFLPKCAVFSGSWAITVRYHNKSILLPSQFECQFNNKMNIAIHSHLR